MRGVGGIQDVAGLTDGVGAAVVDLSKGSAGVVWAVQPAIQSQNAWASSIEPIVA